MANRRGTTGVPSSPSTPHHTSSFTCMPQPPTPWARANPLALHGREGAHLRAMAKAETKATNKAKAKAKKKAKAKAKAKRAKAKAKKKAKAKAFKAKNKPNARAETRPRARGYPLAQGRAEAKKPRATRRAKRPRAKARRQRPQRTANCAQDKEGSNGP